MPADHAAFPDSLPRSPWTSPLFICSLVAAAAVIGLLSQIYLPLGSNYWDISIYLDAAHRMANGQTPSRDFFTPAGPLEYYLFYYTNKIFPAAHPLLSTQLCLLPVALPILLFVVHSVDKESRAAALALALPFLIFLVLPLNTGQFYPAPGFDGYGIYNRHPALLLYLLMAALLFLKDGLRLQALVGAILTCLFFIKITGFATGVLLTGYAVLAGRLGLMRTAVTGAICIGVLLAVEAASGLVSAYGANLLQLAGLNEGSFARRIWAFAGHHLEIYVPASLAALLLWMRRSPANETASDVAGKLRRFLDSDAAWLVAALGASFVFEIQNTGSLEFIYLWPVVLVILRRMRRDSGMRCTTILVLLAALALPSAVNYLQRALQTVTSSFSYSPVNAAALGPLGRVSARPVFITRGDALTQHYAQNREAYRMLARKGIEASDILQAEPDFQASWLKNAADAAVALRAFEANTGKFIDTVYTLDFTDPLPFVLGKTPIKYVPIGVDLKRTLPRNDKRMMQSIASATAILLPQCPVTVMREEFARLMAPALEGRQRITLTPCYDLMIRQGSDFAAR